MRFDETTIHYALNYEDTDKFDVNEFNFDFSKSEHVNLLQKILSKLNSYANIKGVDLFGAELEDDVLKKILPLLANNEHIEIINLRGNEFTDKNIAMIRAFTKDFHGKCLWDDHLMGLLNKNNRNVNNSFRNPSRFFNTTYNGTTQFVQPKNCLTFSDNVNNNFIGNNTNQTSFSSESVHDDRVVTRKRKFDFIENEDSTKREQKRRKIDIDNTNSPTGKVNA